MTTTPSHTTPPETPFVGLAPFLRLNIAGTPLLPIGQEMLAKAEMHPDDANLWMNLSIVMLCLGQRELGLAIQEQALALKRLYQLPAAVQPAKLRLLMLMAPGDIAANTPLECLLENSDISLDFYYVSPGNPLALPVPEHDVAIVAMSEDEANRPHLKALEKALVAWPKPVINAAQNIPTTGRAQASRLLQNIPGLLIPPTTQLPRPLLQAVATGSARLPDLFPGCNFPIIVRPLGSHAGRDLEKINSPAEIAAYLDKVDDSAFFLSRFVDYSGKDGLFRKFRIALIDGQPFACHMGVSAHWMIHYLNAGMYDNADKRDEEASFMDNFADFAQRHQVALAAIHQRTRLDYVCIDCAETPDGQLLIFEIDHAMVVHAMDPEDLFPYKQAHMQKVKKAFCDYLFRLTAESESAIRCGL